MRRAALLLIATIFTLCGILDSTAHAGGNDFRLNRLGGCAEGTTPGPAGGCQAQGDAEAFKAFASSLGQVLAPAVLTTAETLGEAGFTIAFETKISIADDGDHWRALNSSDSADPTTDGPVFTMLQLTARKGLPFSFELDATLSWMLDSEMLWLGGGVKWTVIEAINPFVPDLAARGFGGTLLGAPDINLTTAGLDVILSKAIGIGGLISLTPFGGVKLLWTIASSRVLDVDPTFGATPSGSYQPEFLFDQQEIASQMGFAGASFNISYVEVTAQYSFNFDFDVHTVAFSLGGEF